MKQSRHKYDSDGCCLFCGFDGAEWAWWKHHTYEGKAQPEAKMPPCNKGESNETYLAPQERERLTPLLRRAFDRLPTQWDELRREIAAAIRQGKG